MKVIFYDRKNNREVSNKELKKTNCVVELVRCDDEAKMYPEYPYTMQIGSYGYKSKNCPKYQNWDLYCMLNDLVFLRLEDE